ncbi:hypothetical protein BKG58_19915 [Mycobacteroides abscessus subsp. abscessus]|uniref:hypothetical protein n=1 Tax=Mycobacteroides abscessus TaxID=36809 RepID=UPI0003454B2E|nr:hypothetical protein [Mycobacteroides abscessus]OLT79697.1 hypothetical protein BKG58_19915 [Mycobacteroides abscessus subsp. abscessus]SHP95497.1 Uncharacterised protein [Mycobacteroides abscessus subsp. abscessus]SKO07007.1 Uncharacterised protein [Mycobacteroides abscessus subsp. abscessus]
MIAHEVAEATPAHDTPKTPEAVASSLSELHDLLTRPRAAGEPLTVLLEGPAAKDLLGEVAAVRVAVTGGEAAA